MKRVDPRSLLKGLVLIATLGALGWAMQRAGIDRVLDTGWIDGAVKGRGVEGLALFLGLGAAAVAVGLPRQAVCFLAGYAEGLAGGILLAQLASIAGCALAFAYARLLGRDFVRRRLGERARRIDAFVAGNAFAATVLIRFLPVGSNLLTNLVAGISAVRPAPFLLGSFVGYLPQTIVFALLGSGIRVDPGPRIALAVALFLVSAALGVALYRRAALGGAKRN